MTPQGEEMSGAFPFQEPRCPQHPRNVPNIPGRSQKSQSSTQSLDARAGRSCSRKEGIPKTQHGQMQGELRTILHPRGAVPGATKPGTAPRSKVPVRTQDPESLCPGMSNSRMRHFPNPSGKGRFLLHPWGTCRGYHHVPRHGTCHVPDATKLEQGHERHWAGNAQCQGLFTCLCPGDLHPFSQCCGCGQTGSQWSCGSGETTPMVLCRSHSQLALTPSNLSHPIEGNHTKLRFQEGTGTQL